MRRQSLPSNHEVRISGGRRLARRAHRTGRQGADRPWLTSDHTNQILIEATVGGEPIDLERMYTVATSTGGGFRLRGREV